MSISSCAARLVDVPLNLLQRAVVRSYVGY